MFAHLRRTGRTIQPDHVNTQWLKSCQCCTNFRPQQHCSGCFHSNFNENRKLNALFFDSLLAAVDCCFCLQKILRCFHQECVCAASNQSHGLLGKGGLQIRIRGVTEGGKFCSRAHGTQDPAHPSVLSLILFGTSPGNTGPCFCKFSDAIFDAVVVKV